MSTKNTDNADKIIEDFLFKDETYKIIGLAYKVFNKLGYGYSERYIQRAFERELKEAGLKYQKEIFVRLEYQGKFLGKYFLDFLIDNKIIVEIKVAKQIHPRFEKQVLQYLKSTGKRLGLILLFTQQGVTPHRIVN